MSSNIKADGDLQLWQDRADWESIDDSKLAKVDLRLKLVLLALEAISNISSKTVIQTAKYLDVESRVGDRLDIWWSSSKLNDAEDRSISVDEAQASILIICYLAKQHQELIRRGVCLLEQADEQNRPPEQTTLLGNYLDNFVDYYQARIDPDCDISSESLSHLAWKQAIALLFYSDRNGRRWLTNAVLDTVPTPFTSHSFVVTAPQRFTPPSCTLEITGSKSFIHRWIDKSSSNQLQFKLRFDDPRQPTAERVTIQGDRQDLERLETAIASYIGQYLAASLTAVTSIETESAIKGDLYLQERSLTDCELFFGSLTHNNQTDRINLSTVQLFDLVTALAAFAETISEPSPLTKNLFCWGGVAAIAIAALSIAAILSRPSSQPNTASSPEPASPQTKPQPDEVSPPDPPRAIARPNSNLKPSEPLTSATRLPPPPAVDALKPKPNIPDPADYPLPNVAKRSGLDNVAPANTVPEQTESTIAIPDETQNERATPSEAQIQTEIEPAANPELSILPNQRSVQSSQEAPSNIALDSSTVKSIQMQVVEYFQKQWQPPAKLKQSLEYRLLLDADGSISKVAPLGQASARYLSQTDIPLSGEPFVTPAAETQPTTIRLLLNPDGKVKAFVE